MPIADESLPIDIQRAPEGLYSVVAASETWALVLHPMDAVSILPTRPHALIYLPVSPTMREVRVKNGGAFRHSFQRPTMPMSTSSKVRSRSGPPVTFWKPASLAG